VRGDLGRSPEVSAYLRPVPLRCQHREPEKEQAMSLIQTVETIHQDIEDRYHVARVGRGRRSSSAEVVRRVLRRGRAADQGRAA
jgi:hypothetical protein